MSNEELVIRLFNRISSRYDIDLIGKITAYIVRSYTPALCEYLIFCTNDDRFFRFIENTIPKIN